MRQILITKADGVMEPFDVAKLESSLLRSGATTDQADQVVRKIIHKIKPGDSTSHIYREAFNILKKLETGIAARYSLRRSLAGLGPSGFPFEIFISKLFQSMGFKTKVGLHLPGKCIDHEVDLIAWNSDSFIMGEVKFHNNFELKNDSKTIMYVHSRYEDLKRSRFGKLQDSNLDPQGWLITNTKFTETTIAYANCYNLKLLGWNYPYNDYNLQNLIESKGLEPVTILTTLSVEQKKLLLDKKIVMCNDLNNNHQILTEIGLGRKQIKQVIIELNKICNCLPFKS